MITETELRTALADFAHVADADEHAVRDRIEASLRTPRRDLRSRLIPLAAIAACIALAVGIAVTVQQFRTHDRTPPSHHTSAVPAPTVYGMRQFPGTVVLAEFSGTGTQTIDASGYPKPASLEYAFVYVCHGQGAFGVSDEFFRPGCGGAGGATLRGTNLSALRVETSPTVHWQLTLIAEPPTRTNAMIGNFPVPTGDGVLGQRTGMGNGTVVLTHAAGSYRIWVTCNGTGVTINSNSAAVRNDYTKTCFAGYNYAWDVKNGSAPTTLEIAASANTSWTLTVTSN